MRQVRISISAILAASASRLSIPYWSFRLLSGNIMGNATAFRRASQWTPCLGYLLKISDIAAFFRRGGSNYSRHINYQAATQSGYYGYKIAPFQKYLHYFSSTNPSATFPPKAAPAKPFDPTLNAKVATWLAEDGNNIVYLYGGIDAWTAAGIIVSDKVNSKRFVVPNATHSTARVKNMNPPMQQEFVKKVKDLSGLDADPGKLE